MSNVQKVFSDSAVTALKSIVSLVKSFILIKIITSFLGIDSYGIWVSVQAIVSLLVSTGGMHLHGALVRYESQHPDNQTFVDTLFLTSVIGGLLAGLGVLVAFFGDVSLLVGENIDSGFALVVVSSLLLFSKFLFSITVNLPRAKGYVKLYELIRLVKDVLQVVLLAGVFVFRGSIVEGLLVLSGIYLLISVIIGFMAFLTLSLPSPAPRNFTKYVRYGLPMIPAALSSKLLTHTDKYLLLYLMGPGPVGIYSVAKRVSQPLTQLTGIFNETLYPTISSAWDEGDYSQIENIYKAIFRFYTLVGIPASLGIIVISRPLVTLISTVEISREATYLVPIFIFGFLFRGFGDSVSYILTSAEKTRTIGVVTGVAAVANLILNLLLIPEFEMVGAAIATFVAQITTFGLYLKYSGSEITIRIPWKSIGRSLFAGTAMFLLLRYANVGVSTAEKLLVYPIAGMLVYFPLLYLFGEFSQTELQKFKNFVSK